MKFTMIRSDQDGRQYVSRMEADKFFNRVMTAPRLGGHEVYPGVEMQRQGDGALSTMRYNNIVVLTVGPLASAADVTAVKQAAALLPPTVAALSCGTGGTAGDGADSSSAGANGRTVKILVSYQAAQEQTVADGTVADTLAAAAYEQAVMTYGRVVGHSIRREQPSASMHFTALADAEAVVNREVIPLTLDGTGSETLQLIDFLARNCEFRYNTVMGYTEYRSRHRVTAGNVAWTPVDERAMSALTISARLSGLDAWDKDVRRYVGSAMVPPFNPISDFLGRARRSWDGTTDHIGALARTVPCDVPQWEGWFRKWMLYMVAQWLGTTRNYGNATVPLLISAQGNNKSTFCRRLLPEDLRWGYTDNLLVSEKKQTLMAMSQFLLINLDEFNQISPALQEGFLKNVIQLASIKVKRPYGRHVEDFPRLASFIATTNEPSVLADASGNRRFIAVELTGPIDVSQPIDYLGLYGQAVTLVERGERYWMSSDEVKQLMAHNRRYQLMSVPEQWFNELYDAHCDEQTGRWMTSAAIFSSLRSHLGSAFKGNLVTFGRALSHMEGLRQRHGEQGKLYLVRPRR